MKNSNNKFLCVISARGGSQGLKNKNLKYFNGKPLIAWTIEQAKKSKFVRDVYISTDSKKIAKIAKNFGAEVPFFRSKKLSDDYTPTYKVLIDCIKKLKSQHVPYHFCIYPTSPKLLILEDVPLNNFYNLIKNSSYNISCHAGFLVHTSLLNNKKTIDINKKKQFFCDWTA
mgnify:CR=1 FL=1